MNTTIKNFIWSVLTLAVTLTICASIFATKKAENPYGAVTSPYTTLTALQLQQGIRIPGGPGVATANLGTPVQGILQGNCVGGATTAQLPLEATSSDDFFCQAPGVQSGDNIQVHLISDGGSVYGGFNVTYEVATTSGQFQFGIQNNTGAATSSFIGVTTTVPYFITR